MASKVSCRNTAQTTGISPAVDAGWGASASNFARCLFSATRPGSDALTTVTVTDTASTDANVCVRQYIMPLKAGQTITGSQAIQFVAKFTETTTGNNMHSAFGIRVIHQDGTVKKTVRAVIREANEFDAGTPGTLESRNNTSTSAATNYTTVAGDYLVIEIGAGGDPTGSNPRSYNIALGDNSATDLDASDVDTGADNPWVQLNDTLIFEYTIELPTIASTQVFAPTTAVNVASPAIASGSALFAPGVGYVLIVPHIRPAGANSCDLNETTISAGSASLDHLTTAIAQSFTGNGEYLLRAEWFIHKEGSPTGSVVSKIYAHTGTFGTSSVPTGVALATSDPVLVSAIPIGGATDWIAFNFPAPITLANGTRYCASIEYTGTASDKIEVWKSGGNAHAGNMSDNFGGSFTPDSSDDVLFRVLTSTTAVYAPASVYEPDTLGVVGFSHYSPYTVNADQVDSPENGYPLLVSVTDNRLKLVANGGNVANGSDIRAFWDAGLTIILPSQIQFYDGATGTLVMRVWTPIILDGTAIYIAYGDDALVTSGDSTDVWDSNFVGAYGFGNGSVLSLLDLTSNGNDGTNSAVVAAAGKVSGAGDFEVGAPASVSFGINTFGPLFHGASAIMVEGWINLESDPPAADYRHIFVLNQGGGFASFVVSIFDTARTLSAGGRSQVSDGFQVFDGAEAVSLGTWAYIAAILDFANDTIRLQVNDNDDETEGSQAWGSSTYNHTTETIDNDSLSLPSASVGWDGLMDEIRISKIGRSRNWRLITYRNEFDPAAFATLGTEVAVGGQSLNDTQLFAPTVSGAAGGDQNVTGSTIASGSALTAPTLAYAVTASTIASGSQTFTPTLAYVVTTPSSVAGTLLYAPTLAQAATTAFISSGEQTFAPTLAYAVTGAFISSGSLLLAPTVSPGAVTLTGAFISSGELTFAPVLAYAVTTATIASGAQTFALAVALEQTLTGSTIASGESTFAPTIAYVVTTSFISSGEQTFAPTVIGAQTLTGSTIASGELTFSPTLAYAITTSFISSGELTFAPTLAYAVTTPSAISGTLLFAPTVSAGAVTLTGAFISSGELTFAPVLAYVVTTAFISSGSQIFAPTSSYDVVAAFISSGSQTFAPTIQMVTEPPAIAATTLLFTPTLAVGAVTLTGAFISSGEVLGPPVVGSGLLMSTLGPDTQLFAPEVEEEAGLTGAFISAGSQTFAPVLAYAITTAFISGTTVSAPAVSYAVVGAFISSGSTLSAPTVAAGAVTIVGASIPSGSTLSPPVLAMATTLPAIPSGSVVNVPAVYTAELTGSTVPSGEETYPPTLAFQIQLPSISDTDLFAPIVSLVITFQPAISKSVTTIRFPSENTGTVSWSRSEDTVSIDKDR